MEIENFEPISHKSIIATFDLVLPQMYLTLRNWKVLRGKNNGWFAVPPSFKSSEDSLGKPVFSPYIHIHEKRRVEFQRALVEALKPFVGHSNGPAASK